MYYVVYIKIHVSPFVHPLKKDQKKNNGCSFVVQSNDLLIFNFLKMFYIVTVFSSVPMPMLVINKNSFKGKVPWFISKLFFFFIKQWFLISFTRIVARKVTLRLVGLFV